jgi:hypothetical protein
MTPEGVAGADRAGGIRSVRRPLPDRTSKEWPMPFVSSVIASASMLAYRVGTLTVVFVVFGAALAGYAIYWMIFKVGKD